jgi:hypothetical protein
MKKHIQVRVSVALLLVGAVGLTYSVTRFAVWSDCDARYKTFLSEVNKDYELTLYFQSKGQNDYLFRVLNFRPSGRMYSGSNDSALPIVGSGALVLLSAFGLFDALRRPQAGAGVQPCAEPGASPNGGPATRSTNSGVAEGPPSVS